MSAITSDRNVNKIANQLTLVVMGVVLTLIGFGFALGVMVAR